MYMLPNSVQILHESEDSGKIFSRVLNYKHSVTSVRQERVVAKNNASYKACSCTS